MSAIRAGAAGLAIAILGLSSAGHAQSSLRWGAGDAVIGEYVAYIGGRDVRNSQGTRLTQAWQVLRQDRANYHRYGLRDRGDEGDSFFASASNRAIMERLVRDGSISTSAARAVVAGDVWVTVRVIGRGDTGSAVQITVN